MNAIIDQDVEILKVLSELTVLESQVKGIILSTDWHRTMPEPDMSVKMIETKGYLSKAIDKIHDLRKMANSHFSNSKHEEEPINEHDESQRVGG